MNRSLLLISQFDVNVIGTIQTINAFLPLLRAGRTKKVIVISGPGDAGTVLSTEDSLYPSYAISKAGVNMAVAKFAVEFKREGFVFVGIDPGAVKIASDSCARYIFRWPIPDVTECSIASEVIEGHYQVHVAELRNAHPEVEGAITVEESVRDQIALIGRVTAMDSGAFLTRTGRKYQRGLAWRLLYVFNLTRSCIYYSIALYSYSILLCHLWSVDIRSLLHQALYMYFDLLDMFN